MNIQNAKNDLANYGDVGLATQNVRLTKSLDKPLAPAEPARQAISSLCISTVTDIRKEIADLRLVLDDIEAAVLVSVERAQHTLQEHVSVCHKITDEIGHFRRVAADLQKQAHDA